MSVRQLGNDQFWQWSGYESALPSFELHCYGFTVLIETSGSQLEVPLSPGDTWLCLQMVFGCRYGDWGVLGASTGWGPEVLLIGLRCIGQSPQQRVTGSNVRSADLHKTWLKRHWIQTARGSKHSPPTLIHVLDDWLSRSQAIGVGPLWELGFWCHSWI